jgi:hypothetical protein
MVQVILFTLLRMSLLALMSMNVFRETQSTAVPKYQTSSSAKPSVKQRIDELDKLAAGGYITPEEYKHKKQAIIDSL